jgi:hypothetical protein
MHVLCYSCWWMVWSGNNHEDWMTVSRCIFYYSLLRMTQRCMPAHNEKPLITFIYTIIYSNVIILAHTFPFSYKMCTRYYHVIIIDNVWLFFVYTYIYAYAFNNAFILLFFKHTHARAHFHAITASVWMNACIFVCIYNVNNTYIYTSMYMCMILCCVVYRPKNVHAGACWSASLAPTGPVPALF